MSNPAVLISIRPIWCGKIFGGFKNLGLFPPDNCGRKGVTCSKIRKA